MNEASDEELQEYVAGTFAGSFLQHVPLEQMMTVHRQIRDAAPLTLEEIESETDQAVVAVLGTATGRRLRAQLSVSGDPPRIDGLLIQPAEEAAAAPLPDRETLDELAAAIVEQSGLPGVAIARARPGEEPAVGVAGVRSIDGDEPVTPGPLEPGYHYSNAGYAVAAYAGERASGRSWTDLVHDEVFEPLGLTSCGVGWPVTADRPDQPRGHFGAGAARRPQGVDEYELGAFMWPVGNLHCLVADLARYGLAHLAGLSGRDGFLETESIRELHRPEPEASPTPPAGTSIPRAASTGTTGRRGPSTPT